MTINTISSKDTNEERVMHSKSDDTEVMTYDVWKKLLINFLNPFFQDVKLV